ncbi:hypothetical protein ACFVVM_26910 [Nocardia sp. NPDC058176]|uniref:hypothetical protein n=1 Tax=Nocardia sp. NPDC058176 TaxID=3346368 RepID=UPI0036D94798
MPSDRATPTPSLDRDAQTAIFDWGDAVITHPMLSMRLLHGRHRAAFLAALGRDAPIGARELQLAEQLAPLVALHPWRTIDTTGGRFEQFVDDLLDRLATGFGHRAPAGGAR